MQSVDDFLARGNEAIESGDNERAVLITSEGIRSHPNEWRLYDQRAFAYFMRDERDKAIADFTEAIRIDPQAVPGPSYSARGQCHLENKQYDRAVADFSKALQLGLEGVPRQGTFRGRGTAYLRQRKWAKAIADLSEAIRLDASDVGPYMARGLAYREQQKFDLAIADLDEAIRLGILDPLPRNTAYINRGIAHDENGDHDKAIADFTEALRNAPEVPRAYHDRGISYLKIGEYERAIADFSEHIKREPDAATYANRALAYQLLGDEENAASDGQQAEELGGKSPLGLLKEERRILQGKWNVVLGNRMGVEVGAKELGLDQVLIVGDRLTLSLDRKETAKYRITINPTHSPKAMDWLNERTNEKLPVVYSVNEKKLQLCFPILQKESGPRAMRPRSFETKGNPVEMIVAEREQ
jgi:uncharacterized protein (TIGR03067 family)